MEKEHEPVVEEKHLETPQDYWDALALMELFKNDDVSGAEYLLLKRPENLMQSKLLGEDEVWLWLEKEAEEKLGRPLLVELNEKGIIVPK